MAARGASSTASAGAGFAAGAAFAPGAGAPRRRRALRAGLAHRQRLRARRPLGIDAHAHPARESGHAIVGELLVAKRDHAADLRRVRALRVGEARADVELRAVGQRADQRAEPTLVLARSVGMADHARFRVVERLHLEQRRRATDRVLRFRLAQHQALAPEPLDTRQLFFEVVDAAALDVIEHACVRCLGLRDHLLRVRHAVFERALRVGSVEDHERDVAPLLSRGTGLHDARRLREHLATDPQLAVERVGRQIGDEPVRREEAITESRGERLAVPVRADAVELLAHPPAGRIVVGLPLVREQDRWRGVLLVRAVMDFDPPPLRAAAVRATSVPRRAVSATSPRYARRCLQVRRSTVAL